MGAYATALAAISTAFLNVERSITLVNAYSAAITAKERVEADKRELALIDDALAARHSQIAALQAVAELRAHPFVPRLLTVDQAAFFIGRTPNALRILMARRKISVIRCDGRPMLDVRDLEHWIDSGRVSKKDSGADERT